MNLVAHRGAVMDFPENTMSAFRRATELGADGIELDVQPPSDGHLVVFHDASLDRTTNGTGLVFETPLTEARELDAGSRHNPAFATERVPVLSEVLALADVEFEIELKGYGTAFLDAVLAAVVHADVLEKSGADRLSTNDVALAVGHLSMLA